MDAKTLEIWLRLAADALKGGDQAQKAMEALAKNPLSADAVAQWWAAWMPKTAGGTEPEEARQFQQLVEDSWKAMGVVPRHRYLELLEKYEQLKARLEEAEHTVRNLRELLGAKGREKEARGVLDSWEEMTKKALETQEEWVRTFVEGMGKDKPGVKK
jgi:hypothetical protein